MSYSPEERAQRVLRYFIKRPEKPNKTIWVLSTAVLSLLIFKGCSQSDLTGGLLAFIGVATLFIVLKIYAQLMKEYRRITGKARFRASDAEMDEWLHIGYSMVIDSAKYRLGVEEDDIVAPALRLDGPSAGSLLAFGDDGKARFSKSQIFLMYLTNRHIAMYTCDFDMGSGTIMSDSTMEFAFGDITNLETRNTTLETYTDVDKIELKGLQTLSLYTSGNNSVSITFLNPINVLDMIMPLRKLLQEYKDNRKNNI